MITREQLQKELSDTKEKLEKLEASIKAMPEGKPVGRWKPENGDYYWFVDEIGYLDAGCCYGGKADEMRYALGNCYKTCEEAEHDLEVKLAHQRLKDAAEGFAPDWGDADYNKYYIYYDNFFGQFSTGICSTQQQDVTYYATKERAQWVIDNMQDDLRLVWGV